MRNLTENELRAPAFNEKYDRKPKPYVKDKTCFMPYDIPESKPKCKRAKKAKHVPVVPFSAPVKQVADATYSQALSYARSL
jgi:hypothetical protein